MWINKNVYLYEKKLAADKIAGLELLIENYSSELKTVKAAKERIRQTELREVEMQRQAGQAHRSNLALLSAGTSQLSGEQINREAQQRQSLLGGLVWQ